MKYVFKNNYFKFYNIPQAIDITELIGAGDGT